MSEVRDQSPVSAIMRILIWRPALMATYLVSLVVLARLLDPAAFGTFAIVAAVYWLADALVDFGVSAHLIRRREAELDERDVASALGFWIATAAAATLVILVAALTVAHFDAPTGLSAALCVICLAMPLAPITRLREMQRLRALDTTILAWVPTAGALAGFAVSATGALLGWGAIALAAGLLTERALYALVLARAPCLQGGVGVRFGGWRPFLAFGSKYTTTELLPKLSELVRLSIIGASLGAPAVGILNRARHVASLNDRVLVDALQPIAMPAMAVALRDGRSAAEIYRAKFDYLSAVAWPAALVIAILAEPLVLVLLGEDWRECVLLVQILALTGLIHPITRMSVKYSALVGLEGAMLRIMWTQHLLMLAMTSAAAMVSLPAVCAALVVAAHIKAYRIFRMVAEHVHDVHHGLMAPAVRSAAIAGLAALGPVVCVITMPADASFASFTAGLVSAAAGWLAGVILSGHRLGSDMREYLGGRLRPS